MRNIHQTETVSYGPTIKVDWDDDSFIHDRGEAVHNSFLKPADR